MKRYIKRCALMFSIVVLFCGTLIGVKTYILRCTSWELPKNIHVLFMGASHVHYGIDDSMLKDCKNLASPGERYMYTYLKLTKLLPDNPQVDTIFLQLAPTDLWEHTDDRYCQDIHKIGFLPHYYPLFNREQFSMFRVSEVATYALNYLFKDWYKSGSDFLEKRGGFMPTEKELLPITTDTMTVQMEKGSFGHSINYNYLNKVISLCNENNIKLYFLYCPVYKPEYFYNQEYYYQAYKDNFSEVELIDYSHVEVPLEYLQDAHHVNIKGARWLTKTLKEQYHLK